MQHIFIIGAKSIGQYGGYETFVDKLTEHHQNNKEIKYHIACKGNGDGFMDEKKLDNVTNTIQNDKGEIIQFTYHNADAFKIKVPNIGSATAIYYDITALNRSVRFCKENNIEHPIFYILACRIGPFISYYKKVISGIGGKLFVNPDGHEWKRAKWSAPIRRYWKYSEKLMIKYADLVICDSIKIEEYIHREYYSFNPNTVYISYGSDIDERLDYSKDSSIDNWLKEHNLHEYGYYLVVGRLVPENNYETMISQFMRSKTERKLVLITNHNDGFKKYLQNKLQYNSDARIEFVGTVYDKELLKRIRNKAYAYLHGHEVGGTNPSLLEALAYTQLNLIIDVDFNREVADNAALYWNKNNNSLSELIDKVDTMDQSIIKQYKSGSIKRISEHYNWERVADKYLDIFLNKENK